MQLEMYTKLMISLLISGRICVLNVAEFITGFRAITLDFNLFSLLVVYSCKNITNEALDCILGQS